MNFIRQARARMENAEVCLDRNKVNECTGQLNTTFLHDLHLMIHRRKWDRSTQNYQQKYAVLLEVSKNSLRAVIVLLLCASRSHLLLVPLPAYLASLYPAVHRSMSLSYFLFNESQTNTTRHPFQYHPQLPIGEYYFYTLPSIIICPRVPICGCYHILSI